MPSNNNTSAERKFDVYKREPNGFTHKIGVVMAANKWQADTKIQMIYRRSLPIGAAVWAVDPMQELSPINQATG